MTPDTDRLDRARDGLRSRGLDAVFVGPGADLRYLVGYDAPLLERPTLLVVPAAGDAVLVVPRLERLRAESSGAGELVTIRAWDETDDPFDLVVDAVGAAGSPPAFAVQDRLFTSFTLELQRRWPGATWVPGSQVIGPLRARKSPAEVAALAAAGAAIDEVHANVPALLRVGRSEAEIGRDIAELIRRTHDHVNFVIVGSGPNGASPHHELGSRRLQAGDTVVVDIGGTLDGYCSDETRDYAVAHAPAGYEELHHLLERAQADAVAAVRPGVAAEAVDAVARDVITAAGHGDRFVHRTGHGIGIEEHEDPYIVAGNDTRLEPGMCFSVEPGIYTPGHHGARIEDIVAVTDDGVRLLNHRPRELYVV